MARHHPFSGGLLATMISVGAGLAAFLLWHNWLVTVIAGVLGGTLVRGFFDVANREANIAGVLAGVGAGLGSVAAGVPAYFAWGLGAGIGVGLGVGAVAAFIGAAVGLIFWPESRKGIELGTRENFPWGVRSSALWQRFEQWVAEGSRRSQGGRHAPQP
jgi:hypothetical protein